MAIVRVGPGQYRKMRKRPEGVKKKLERKALWEMATLGISGAAKLQGIVHIGQIGQKIPKTLAELQIEFPRRTAVEPSSNETEEEAFERIQAELLAAEPKPVSNAAARRIKTRARRLALLRHVTR